MQIDFAPSERSTVGIEWELAMVDRETGALANVGDEVLGALDDAHGGGHPQITHELLKNTVELGSRPHHRVGEAVSDLRELIEEVQAVTDPMAVDLMCAGTHPFAQWYDQEVNRNERYDRLLDRTQWWGRQMLIWGIHVHVGVEKRDKALPLANGLLRYYPHLQALSASSPYWGGVATGYASNRALMFQQLPTAGLPWQLETWSEYEGYVEDLQRTGIVDDYTEVRWDIRPSAHWGTIEMRACDGLSTSEEVGAVAALIQCLVEHLSVAVDEGRAEPILPPWFTRENKWRAARYGLEAEVITSPGGDERLVTDDLRELLVELAPVAERLGCTEELGGVQAILDRGASYQRQLAVADAHDGDLVAVVASLTRELRGGLGS